MRVLVAEDNKVLANVIVFNLKREGFDVFHAPSGDVAWKQLQQEYFDLVITDYQMPNMNGGELTQLIRRQPSLEAIPVILLTAKGLELDNEYCRETLGVNAIMNKPFSPRRLIQFIQELAPVSTEKQNGR
jgi:CheY-like chemotaxis protein